MQLWGAKYNSNKIYFVKKIDRWISVHNFYNSNIAKRIFALILQINVHSIVSLCVRNQCINIFTDSYLYKIQLYGDNIKKDLDNRKLFYDSRIPLLSPIKIYRKYPLVIKMPILDRIVADEAVVEYIFSRLKKSGYEAEFIIKDYPFVIEGLNILKNCSYGVRAVKKIEKYLCDREGTKVRIGVVHGDLHRGNIMCKGGKPLLIDFDCARYCDIQDIDILYFILEEIRHKHGYKKSWLDEWLLIYEDISVICEFSFFKQIEIDLKFGLILLCLERLAQSYRENVLFIEQNKKSIRNINWKLCDL